MNGPQFDVKDSGERKSFASGMVRDVEDDKTDYTLVMDGPMFERWAVHLTKGAKKYAARNWMKATDTEELERFKRSALRHFIQWMRGDIDEDHAAAVFFNINGAEYTKGKQQGKQLMQAILGPDNTVKIPEDFGAVQYSSGFAYGLSEEHSDRRKR